MNDDFGNIPEELANRLQNFIYMRVSNQQDAEDIVQEIHIKIYRNLDKLNDTGKLPAWAFQIARNAIYDYYRGRRPEEPVAELPEPDESRADENSNKEMAGCLKGMIEHLSEKDREAIILTQYKGLTQKELGEFLGLSHSGAKSRVQRAQQRLKKMLCECCSLEVDRRGNVIAYKQNAKTNPFCDLK